MSVGKGKSVKAIPHHIATVSMRDTNKMLKIDENREKNSLWHSEASSTFDQSDALESTRPQVATQARGTGDTSSALRMHRRG